jgi:uncharacterized protein with HEPN domain
MGFISFGAMPVLRHEYDAVDPAVIWEIIEKDLVPLSRAVEKAIDILRDGKH